MRCGGNRAARNRRAEMRSAAQGRAALSRKNQSSPRSDDTRLAPTKRAQQSKKFNSPESPLKVLRQQNSLLSRVRRQLRLILGDLGGRALLEVAIDCACRRGDLATLDTI